MITLKWNAPDTTPTVEKNDEKLFWIAVKSGDKEHVFTAQYQNRPADLNDDGEPTNDECLYDPYGEPVNSVGWVDEKNHPDFDCFYDTIQFNDDYKLLGWAEYTPPVFTGIHQTIKSAPVERDECGFWIHPDYPADWVENPDLRTETVKQWEKDNQIKVEYTSPLATGQTLKEWQPEIPENSFLISVFDSDCGSAAMYAIPEGEK